jgi:hypothetical protein
MARHFMLTSLESAAACKADLERISIGNFIYLADIGYRMIVPQLLQAEVRNARSEV